MYAACELINYELSSDDTDPISFNDHGDMVFPPIKPSEAPLRRKVAMYMEFASNCASMASALWVNFGINCIVLDGSVPVSRRRDVVQAWMRGVDLKNRPCRVIIITKVGSVGINLSVADRLIIMVSCPALSGFVLLTLIYLLFSYRMCVGLHKIHIKSLVVFIASLRINLSLFIISMLTHLLMLSCTFAPSTSPCISRLSTTVIFLEVSCHSYSVFTVH